MQESRWNNFKRKFVVYLKRNTRIITLLLLIVTNCTFAFLMSDHSQAIVRSTFKPGAIVFFIITIASFMSILTFTGFKKFNKKAILPISITSALLVLQIVLNIIFTDSFVKQLPTALATYLPFFTTTISWMRVHLVFLCITLASIPLLPLISKLLGLIDVSVQEQKPDYFDGEAIVGELEEE